jgi:hypothetical protein
MLSEAAIKWTKYTLLMTVKNRRKDSLLEKLLFGKLGFFEIECTQAEAGLVTKPVRRNRAKKKDQMRERERERERERKAPPSALPFPF